MKSIFEHSYEFLTLIIFYRVFARRIQRKQNMYYFVGCFGFPKKFYDTVIFS